MLAARALRAAVRAALAQRAGAARQELAASPQACRLAAVLPQPPARPLSSATRQRGSASHGGAVEPVAASGARVLVKPTYLPGAGYFEVSGVVPSWRLSQLHAHVQNELRLRDVGATQLSLRLAQRGGGPPDAAAERDAARLDLDPTASLAAAGVVDGSWLLVDLRSALPQRNTRQNVTLLTDLLDEPKSSRIVLPRLSEARLQHILTLYSAIGLQETLEDGAPLLGELDEIRDGASYYIRPKNAVSQLSDKVSALRDNTHNVAAALENEAAERLRLELQRRHKRADRVSSKVHVPSGNAKSFELDAVVVTDSCAAVVEVKTVLNELAGVQLQRNVHIINDLKDSPHCPPELSVFVGKRIIPVLAGLIVKPLAKNISAEQLVAEWRAAGISLLLPGGAGLGFHDGCFQAAPFDAA